MLDVTTSAAMAVKKALRYGGYSAAVLALGTLFFEYWPIRMSLAFSHLPHVQKRGCAGYIL
jgi:hypothetical protein